jgi:hypothetical protein
VGKDELFTPGQPLYGPTYARGFRELGATLCPGL